VHHNRAPICLATSVSTALLLTACGTDGPGAQQPVIVNVPASNDSGTTVLLAVLGMVAFGLLAGLMVAAMSWLGERRRRLAAEDVVIALTGSSVRQLGLSAAAPVSVDRLRELR
jgi:hypothetical protein